MVKNIILKTTINGSKYQGGIDREGLELADVQLVTSFEANSREYYCNNCGTTWDGSHTFEEVKKHFGTFPID